MRTLKLFPSLALVLALLSAMLLACGEDGNARSAPDGNGDGRSSTVAPTAAPPAPSAAPPPESRLDWDAALETVDGDHELLGKMLEGFLGQQPALVAELREAFRASDLPVVKRVAHTIGGSLRSFDGARVVALANDLEDRCREGSVDEAAAAWRALEPELAEVTAELRDRVGNQR